MAIKVGLLSGLSKAEAMVWMARMAAADGVITAKERQLLREFAEAYDLDISRIIRLAYGFTKGVELPEVVLMSRNKMKGLLFEQFIVSLLGSNCRLLAWRSDKVVGDIYAAENLYPDLHIRHKLDTGEVEYFVECKYRSKWDNDGIDLSKNFNRYCSYAMRQGIELFFALGVGGSPSDPDELFIIPGRRLSRGKKIERSRFLGCRCEKSPKAYQHYITDHYCKLQR